MNAEDRFHYTQSAIEDYLAIFKMPRRLTLEAKARLVETGLLAMHHFTKPNGAKVYRATGTRHYLLAVKNPGDPIPSVVSIGPPSENHPAPPSCDKPKKPGESKFWWNLEEGDVEAPRDKMLNPDGTPHGASAKRVDRPPILAELDVLTKAAGWQNADLGRALGVDKDKAQRLRAGRGLGSLDQLLPKIEEVVTQLRRELGIARAPGRPKTAEPMVPVSGRVPQYLADYLTEKGGWDYVRKLLLVDYQKNRRPSGE